jgi:transcriptional regulator with XRE-family HTH domain
VHKQFVTGWNVARFFVTNDERFYGESNASFVARIAWKYRINPAQLVSKAILNKSHTNSDLRYGVASICNSLTNKSLHVQERLRDITGQDRTIGNYTHLRGVLDHGAHGLISKEKKWCHRCYQNRRELSIDEDETPIFDDLYWSFKHSEYCIEHHCTLSSKCGHCFHKQPFISHKVEPGYCHHCRGFLGKAPSIDIGDDSEAIELAMAGLSRHDVFLRSGIPSENISISVLAQNLRQLADRFGEDGITLIAGACGVSGTTYSDWCRAKHNLNVESLFMLIDGLGLPTVGSLFIDEAEFCSMVSPHLSRQFQFRTKKHYDSALPEITRNLNAIISGNRPSESRAAIAKRFNVSVGMLENAFSEELEKISAIFHEENSEISLSRKGHLQYLMDLAVRRCGAKMRKFDWPHILAELKDINLNGYTPVQLSDAREQAIERYIHSTRRDQSRDIDSLL